ncbi:MAG: hypoxanthine phosphoribosyltransferase [Candidatus Eremiobacteraeota bacterium]|nr:hypoxanthine phosphoribosyltransferase [Candidatus Eremiobacteraeota bacterium]
MALPVVDETAIADRVRALGHQISQEYAGKSPIIIGVLNACVTFLADLTRAISIPCEFDFIAVSRLAENRSVRFEKDTSASVEGRHVLLIDDMIDTGLTLEYVIKTLSARNPASVAVCTLLTRPKRRLAAIDVAYSGFDVPNSFLVGYGLDYHGLFRELPALYAHGSWPLGVGTT